MVLAQMFDNGNHMNDWGWGWFVLIMIVMIALISLAVWLIVRGTTSTRTNGQGRAREILDERLARGEITPDEHRQAAQHLR